LIVIRSICAHQPLLSLIDVGHRGSTSRLRARDHQLIMMVHEPLVHHKRRAQLCPTAPIARLHTCTSSASSSSFSSRSSSSSLAPEASRPYCPPAAGLRAEACRICRDFALALTGLCERGATSSSLSSYSIVWSRLLSMSSFFDSATERVIRTSRPLSYTSSSPKPL